jgi:hypothetical protein
MVDSEECNWYHIISDAIDEVYHKSLSLYPGLSVHEGRAGFLQEQVK